RFTALGATPARHAPTRPATASVLPRDAPAKFPAWWPTQNMPAPARIAPSEPHSAACANQFRIVCSRSAPGIPFVVGFTVTSASTRSTVDAKCICTPPPERRPARPPLTHLQGLTHPGARPPLDVEVNHALEGGPSRAFTFSATASRRTDRHDRN